MSKIIIVDMKMLKNFQMMNRQMRRVSKIGQLHYCEVTLYLKIQIRIIKRK